MHIKGAIIVKSIITKSLVLLSLVGTSLPFTVVGAEAAIQTELTFQVPMNTYCGPNNPIEFSFEFVNTKDTSANVTLHLYKKDGTEFTSTGTSYDGIESTVTPGTISTLTKNAAGLYHINYGSQQSCSERVYSGKLVSESGTSTILARGWVDSKHGTERVIVKDDLGTSRPPADTTAPAAVMNLTAGSPTLTSITLNWTAPGNDGTVGTATYYDIRYSTSPITEANWAIATQVSGEPAPAIAGNNQSMEITGLNPNTTYYFAIKTSDEIPNISVISNSPNAKTLAQTYSVDLTDGLPSSAFSSSTNWSTQGPEKAFNNVWNAGNDVNAYFTSSGHLTNEWIKVDFGSEKAIAKLRYQAAIFDNYRVGMKNFKVQASSDNTSWIDQYTGIALPNSSIQEFAWTPTNSFKYWRIYLIDNHGNGNYFGISEMEMMAAQ